ncbi:MAG: hypothetical protein K6F93_02505 [Lachnospiraceae bacterium]|nr:hypothetical protein [Lachnospiraceae bacterium]
MGLFRRKKKKEHIDDQDPILRWMTVDEALAYSNGDTSVLEKAVGKIAYEYKILARELSEKQEEIKQDYTLDTELLGDIKRFEMLPEKTRASIVDSARLIMNLGDERTRFLNKEKKISGEQKRSMAQYDALLPEKLEEIRQKEEYLVLVQEDMRKLEGEKGIIAFEREKAVEKRRFLGKFSVFVATAALLIFILLLILMKNGNDKLMPAFFVTGVSVIGFAFYYYISMKECASIIHRCDVSNNRAQQLLNKVKIKYVNTSGTLEYMYEKYHVKGYSDLKNTWEEYVHEKESEKMYASNTRLLAGYEQTLLEELHRSGFVHPKSLVTEPEILFNRSEMLRYKQSLEESREKLRRMLDEGMRQALELKKEVDDAKSRYPMCEKLFDGVYE